LHLIKEDVIGEEALMYLGVTQCIEEGRDEIVLVYQPFIYGID